MQLRTRGHDFELPTIKYEFVKRNFIFRSLFWATNGSPYAIGPLSVCLS